MSDIPTNTIPPNVTPAVLTSEDRCETHGLILDCCGNCRRCDDAPRRPRRVQMTRNRPWRAEHPDAVVVDRRSRWGNPFRIGRTYDMWVHDVTPKGYVETVEQAVELFRQYTGFHFVPIKPEARPYRGIYTYGLESLASHARRLLVGRDLACWCPLDQPCHADVLLEIANGTGR